MEGPTGPARPAGSRSAAPTWEEQLAEITGTFERACASAASSPGFEGVYCSPLWDVPVREGGPTSRAYKRSVLRRVPGAGAEPWGHLFLLITLAGEGSLSLDPDPGVPSLPGTSGPSPTLRTVVLREGPPRVHLLLRPRSVATAARLEAFAAEIRRGFLPSP